MGLTPGRDEFLRSVVSGVAKRRKTLFDKGRDERDAAKYCDAVLPILVALQGAHPVHLAFVGQSPKLAG